MLSNRDLILLAVMVDPQHERGVLVGIFGAGDDRVTPVGECVLQAHLSILLHARFVDNLLLIESKLDKKLSPRFAYI